MDELLTVIIMTMTIAIITAGATDTAEMDTEALIRSRGYRAETHSVTTDDGYTLLAHRIPTTAADVIVVVVHGLLTSSRDFVVRRRGLGFALSDAGADVWLLNLRCTEYARHYRAAPDSAEYWRFALDAHADKDLTAAIEYILANTRDPRAQLHYVGFSLGCVAYLMMCDSRPDLAARIASFTAMAPSVYLSNVRKLSTAVLGWRAFKMARALGVHRLWMTCGLGLNACWALVFAVAGENYAQVDWNEGAKAFARVQPVGVRQLEHFAQLAAKGVLAKFDHGPEGNAMVYGSRDAPVYNVSANVAPTLLVFGRKDALLSEGDMTRLVDVMRTSAPVALLHTKHDYNHVDFLYGKDVAEDVYAPVIRRIVIISRLRRRNEYVI